MTQLTFNDGLRFGCGFMVAALLFWIGITVLMVIVGLLLTVLGVGGGLMVPGMLGG